MFKAGQQILSANVALETAGFANTAAAKRAVVAYRHLLHALGRHGRQLLGSDERLRGIRASLNADPRDAAAVNLVDYLTHVGRREHPGMHPATLRPIVVVASRWPGRRWGARRGTADRPCRRCDASGTVAATYYTL